MPIFTLGREKRREGKFPIKEEAKKGERKISNQRKGNSQSKSGRKQKEKKENSQSNNGRKKKEEKKGKKAPDQGSKENRRNMQKQKVMLRYPSSTRISK